MFLGVQVHSISDAPGQVIWPETLTFWNGHSSKISGFLYFLMNFCLSGIHSRMNYVLLMGALMVFYHACGMMKSAVFLR
jgi:hypothetical protein